MVRYCLLLILALRIDDDGAVMGYLFEFLGVYVIIIWLNSIFDSIILLLRNKTLII